ncbi:hypothetical protein BOFE_09050 (plasmid) [Candidatus Borrelia fainii]|uniref:Uncharacterized protein n=1 Tax=Candidatus Borrelia fainii TaxID=2518322 RepID=A0ABM8DLG9_9SPIR|nr:DUF228 domain-containing protein [Candidatus Borrelia fainii]BDU63365.1 hypothetical protein BOFE_09050 [Candidatus Borrelia fainii]
MPDKSEPEAAIPIVDKGKIENKIASFRKKRQTSILEQLKNYSTYPAVFDRTSQFRASDFYFTHRGGLQYSVADKLENYQAINFCYKRGVKLVIENGIAPRVAYGGLRDLYGICIDYDESTKTATVISTASSFECILLSDSSIKAGDKLAFNDLGLLEKIVDSTPVQAIALSDAYEFKDNPGFHGTKIMFISRPAA